MKIAFFMMKGYLVYSIRNNPIQIKAGEKCFKKDGIRGIATALFVNIKITLIVYFTDREYFYLPDENQ